MYRSLPPQYTHSRTRYTYHKSLHILETFTRFLEHFSGAMLLASNLFIKGRSMSRVML